MDANPSAARPWIEEAAPQFTTLIDQDHQVATLYNMVNVPQAVWIDEQGMIVRPTETGGSLDILREFDFSAGAFPDNATQRSQATKQRYLQAVESWVLEGDASPYLLSAEQIQARTPKMTEQVAEAHVVFRLGQYLARQGSAQEAQALFAKARELHPDSWNMFRETTERMDNGIAAGPEFWEKVMALSEDEAYYAPIDL